MEEVKQELIHPVVPNESKSFPKSTLVIGAVIVLIGILSGFFLSKNKNGVSSVTSGGKEVKTQTIVGSTDTKAFPDQVEGTLEKGGIDGEGTHKLVRPGGESQTVYLTSSVLNMDDYVGKKVRIWGATFAAQKAGWLMDVGRVEVIQ